MSTLKTNNVQVGQSGTATNNFTLYQPSTPDGTVRLGVGNTGATTADVITANNSGNVGIGVTPASFATVKAIQLNTASTLMAFTDELDIAQNVYYNAGNKYITNAAASMYVQTGGQHLWYRAASGTAGNAISFTQVMGVDTNNNLQFNSGYGSVATAYGCRAWVNFNGTGTVAIRASGNVSSITDNGTGDYTVNFTNAMPDANYSATGFAWASNKNAAAIFLGPKTTATNPETTSSIRVATRDNISETILYDADVVNITVFR